MPGAYSSLRAEMLRHDVGQEMMKRITVIFACLVVAGCAASRVEELKRQMLADRQIMMEHPVETEEHGAARQRFNRDAYELIRIGYFVEEVIPLEHIRQNSPRAQALWDELNTIANPATHLSEGCWSPELGHDPERFTIWDTPKNIPKWEAIIKKYDVPETESGQQTPAGDVLKAAPEE